MRTRLRTLMFRIWYFYVNTIDKDADILLMNYGYHDSNEEIELKPEYESNRYSIQLYHRLAKSIDLENKSLVEIGCGRGGGLAYITERFSTASSLGIDLDKRAVNFGNKHHKIKGLKFLQGNAQDLQLPDNSFDCVLNVESSHRYPNFPLFLSEVKRILKPNGYFLFTDFRYSNEYPAMLKHLENIGLTKIEQQDINDQVLEALNLDHHRRQKLVEKLIPKFLHKAGLNFAGTIGSSTYNQMQAHDYKYFLYIFKKEA
jgi:ubiquinone/menaquinone biosynthesis C-methylase UbiE